VAQERAQDGGLHLVEAAVDAVLLVPVPVALPSVAQPPQAGGERLIVDEHGAAVAQGAEVLGRVEGERAQPGERADRAPLVPRPVRLAGVLHQSDPAPAREVEQRIEVGGMAVEVHGQERPRARGERLLHGFGRHVERRGIEVGEHGPRARAQDAERGESGAERRGHDLVARAHAQRLERELDRLRAVGHAHGVFRPERLREFALEGLAFGSQHEPSRVEHAAHRLLDLAAHRGHVAAEVEEGDVHGRRSEPPGAGAAADPSSRRPRCSRRKTSSIHSLPRSSSVRATRGTLKNWLRP
jgi:hypothetical protein